MGWILSTKYKATDLDGIKDFAAYPELRWLERYNWIGPWALGIASFLLFGWGGLLIGFFLSTVLLWHGTFLVNSMAHIVGRRRYATPDTSRNSFVIALITGGEGWHNNHHYLPASVRQGFRWWEYDPTWYVLKGLAALHVVRDLKNPPARLLDQARVRDGAFDIGMFRSYWERAAKVTGERIADLSARPMRSVDRGVRRNDRRRPIEPTGRDPADRIRRTAVGPGRTHRPGARVGRPAGRRHPAAEGHQGGVARARRHRTRTGMSPAPPAPGSRRRCGSSTSTACCGWRASPSATWPERWTTLTAGGIPGGVRHQQLVADHRTADRTAGRGSASTPDPTTWSPRPGWPPRCWSPGQRVHMLAGDGSARRWRNGASRSPTDGRRDAAVVGWSRDFDFAALAAVSAVARGDRSAHRHQRRPDPSDARRPAARVGRTAGRGGHRVGGRAPGGGQAQPADGRVHPSPCPGGRGYRGDGGGPARHRRRAGRAARHPLRPGRFGGDPARARRSTACPVAVRAADLVLWCRTSG